MIDRKKLRNVIDHALHQGQGESKPSVDAVMGWVDAEHVEVQDPALARVEALCDEVELGVAYSMGNAELPEWVPLIRAALRGDNA